MIKLTHWHQRSQRWRVQRPTSMTTGWTYSDPLGVLERFVHIVYDKYTRTSGENLGLMEKLATEFSTQAGIFHFVKGAFGENCWTNVAPQQHLMGGNEEFRCREECSIFFMWECARFELLLLKVGRKNVHRNCIIKKKLKLCIQRVLRHLWNATFNLFLPALHGIGPLIT